MDDFLIYFSTTLKQYVRMVSLMMEKNVIVERRRWNNKCVLFPDNRLFPNMFESTQKCGVEYDIETRPWCE